ncbi:MAG TPA: prolyl oligopeptidase family serine peptidase, partial [Gemmatimonadaceae bacterium]|nr:prolyl oligopeptidase family serine peptidase [Gemmatimonadaceae bacterium]
VRARDHYAEDAAVRIERPVTQRALARYAENHPIDGMPNNCFRLVAPLAVAMLLPKASIAQRPASFTLEQVRSYPFPNELTAGSSGNRIAWTFNERGQRNLWVAEGPEWTARKLTSYLQDDGQELTSISITPDGKHVVYVRGGDHGSNWQGPSPNPLSSPVAPKIQLWSIPFDCRTPARCEPKLLSEGDDPEMSPRGNQVAFLKDRQIWTVPADGSSPAKRLFSAIGELESPRWSPDGSRLAFVSSRGDHAFIGVFTSDSTPILWLAPTTSRDGSPRWSPDGARIAFIRQPGSGGPPDSILVRTRRRWAIWTADSRTGQARLIWDAPDKSFPSTHGGTNLHWAANGRIVFLSNAAGQAQLYSVPEGGGTPLLLAPGNFMAEHITLSPDGRFLVFAANAGSDPGDIDRRHIVKVPVDRAAPQVLTPGSGLEWTPFVTGDGKSIAFIGATATRPPLPAIIGVDGGKAAWIAEDRIPRDFPATLVTPTQVVLPSSDGLRIHAQLFNATGSTSRKPAIIYIHGGPPRQMLLGWNYSDYYSNAYALNQYLASRGFVVLVVNYRLGIGYGRDFQQARQAGSQGAAEYRDIRAAGEWLASQPFVDAKRIGVYGGSYGGFLTAMALARNSELFAAGVDIHGVHDWTTERARGILNRDRYEEAPDLALALRTAWTSSPVSYMKTWKSPVLLIHGDDDRNVRFSQTVDLSRRLAASGVPFEELIIPDDTHHFMRHSNWLRVDAAVADFLERKLGPRR